MLLVLDVPRLIRKHISYYPIYRGSEKGISGCVTPCVLEVSQAFRQEGSSERKCISRLC